MLKRGDRSPAVAELQRLLKDAGFNPGPIDGIFGPMTERALAAFQAVEGLYADGIAGPSTMDALVVEEERDLPITRPIEMIVIHCSATRPGQDIGVAEIRQWHTSTPRHWNDIGYHWIIRRNGVIELGRPMAQPGAHASGHNARSIGVCLVGGVNDNNQPAANYTPEQWTSLRLVIDGLSHRWPQAWICGHRDLPGVNKACPSFSVADWLRCARVP